MDLAKEPAGLRRYMVMPMKTSLATTISIAGVVAAGAFTFAVNSTMLTSVSTSTELPSVDAAVLSPGSSGLAVLSPPSSVSVVGSQSVGSYRSAPTSSSPSLSIAPTTTVQVGQSTVSSYSIQGAASVQLVQSPSHLSIGGVKPQDGYVYSAENVSATRVIVTISNSQHRLKFNAEIIGGRVVTSLIASDVVAPVVTAAPAVAASPSSTAPSRTRSHHDDDDDERDEREDHDDD
jgi:hypothetical protein